MKTKVIFRKYKNGDVIALFPELAATVGNPYHCESYMHVGQHSAADPQCVVELTKPAAPIEYKDLEEELMRRDYDLQIIHRNRYAFIDTRRKQLKK